MSAFTLAVFFGMYPFSVAALLFLGVPLAGYALICAARRRLPSFAEVVLVVPMIYAVMSFASSGCVDLREWSRKSCCCNNLRQIMLSLHCYHERYGSFPPAYVANANGRPIHSWRVLILPYIEQRQLYDAYRFDEPWDGPNNRRLRMVRVAQYECPEHGFEGTLTSYVAVAGPETAWPGPKCVKFKDVTDGTSNTLMVAEIAESGIHWLEPRDLNTATMSLSVNADDKQGVSSLHRETSWRRGLLGAHIRMADGGVRFLPTNTPAEKL
jgi:hypothetical protein